MTEGIGYLPYGGAGMVLLDLADVERPRLLGRLRVSPPFHGGLYGTGVHSVLPLPRRRLAVIDGEAHEERCREPLNIAGIVDVVEHERSGLLVTPGDAVDLARALAALARDPERRAAMGERARQVAVSGFDERDVLEGYRSLFREVSRWTRG